MIAPESFQPAVIPISRKEGDSSYVVITLPEIIDPSEFSEIEFAIFSNDLKVVSKKLSTNDGIVTVDGQDITVRILKADLKGLPEVCYYECQLSGTVNDDVLTVVEGNFNVSKEYIS